MIVAVLSLVLLFSLQCLFLYYCESSKNKLKVLRAFFCICLFCAIFFFSSCHVVGVATLDDLEPLVKQDEKTAVYLYQQDERAFPLLQSAQQNTQDFTFAKRSNFLPALMDFAKSGNYAELLAGVTTVAFAYVQRQRGKERKKAREQIDIASALEPQTAKQISPLMSV